MGQAGPGSGLGSDIMVEKEKKILIVSYFSLFYSIIDHIHINLFVRLESNLIGLYNFSPSTSLTLSFPSSLYPFISLSLTIPSPFRGRARGGVKGEG